ncbi:MAG: gliding motility-associated C-terminal domain-containing protein [Chitinivibrionales bacterium]
MHFFRLILIFRCGVLLILLISAEIFSHVVLTELLHDPVGGETKCPGGACLEFIEFTNIGCTPVSLRHLLITDGSTTDSIICWPQPLADHPDAVYALDSLLCGQSLLILDPDYLSAPASSRLPINGRPIICTVNHTSLLGGLTKNRAVFLYRGTRNHIRDSLYALIDTSQEISLHQQFSYQNVLDVPEGWSRTPQNVLFQTTAWRSSGRLTPGYIQTHEQRWIVEYRLYKSQDQMVLCSIAVFDTMYSQESRPSWSLADMDGRTISSPQYIDSCLFYTSTTIPLDTSTVQIRIDCEAQRFTTAIDLSGFIIPTYSLCFSELSPRINSFTEWIEVTNESSAPIDLATFTIHTSEDSFRISPEYTCIDPAGFFILAEDASIFSDRYPLITNVIEPERWEKLNDYSDTLYLKHISGRVSDSIIYDKNWFTQWDGGSLQRVNTKRPATDSTNWIVSDDISPGVPNKNPRWRDVRGPSLDIGPSPFTPDGDGRDDKLLITACLPAGKSADLSIYSFDGVLRYEKRNFSGQRLLWDGNDRYGKAAPAGPFFVVMKVTGGSQSETLIKKGILWR